MPSHVERHINSFTGPHRFLSNFFSLQYPLVCEHRLYYYSVEAAYQASKTLYRADRVDIAKLSPAKAKIAGQSLELREDWAQIKLAVMKQFLLQKFLFNEDCREWLLETKDAVLIEGNHWGDRFYGTVNGEGENHLGILLMEVRELLR
jgi:ribA/ribD-fused uncharacterized protein